MILNKSHCYVVLELLSFGLNAQEMRHTSLNGQCVKYTCAYCHQRYHAYFTQGSLRGEGKQEISLIVLSIGTQNLIHGTNACQYQKKNYAK